VVVEPAGVEPFAKVNLPAPCPVVDPAMSETFPVGVPVAGAFAATVMLTGTDCPCVMFTAVVLFKVRVVVLAFTMAVCHWLMRLVALTDPRPVVSSYPVPAVKPVSPGMFVFPDVVSLKMQVLIGRVVVFDPLQEDSVSPPASL
jgi:hypothetical protein